MIMAYALGLGLVEHGKLLSVICSHSYGASAVFCIRYGENPHQAAAFYTDLSLAEYNKGGIATAVQHHGKEMSYNNYLDADAAYSCCCDFKVGITLQLYAATTYSSSSQSAFLK